MPTSLDQLRGDPGKREPVPQSEIGSAGKHLPWNSVRGYSGTGIPKGRYTIPAGPWRSVDDSIVVVAGTVDGYCMYTKVSSIWPNNYHGVLQVYDADVDIVPLYPREEEEEYAPSSCDDPYTDIVEEECDQYPSGPSVGGGDPHTSSFSGGGGSVACMVTDYYESSDGGRTWHYVESVIDYCWVHY